MDCAIHPGVDAPYQCYRCKQWVCTRCEVKIEGRSMCRSCYANLRAQLAARYEAEQRNVNYLLGFLAAAAAAAVIAYLGAQLSAFVHYRLPFVVALMGGAVGYTVVYSAGGKRSEALQKMAALITLVGAFGIWLLSSALMGAPARYGASGFETPFTAALSTFPTYVMKDLGVLDWIFLAAGVVWAYWTPHPRFIPE